LRWRHAGPGLDEIDAAQQAFARHRIGHIAEGDGSGTAHQGPLETTDHVVIFGDVEFAVAEKTPIADFIDSHHSPPLEAPPDAAVASGARRQCDAGAALNGTQDGSNAQKGP
jgi:hypothetical protein